MAKALIPCSSYRRVFSFLSLKVTRKFFPKLALIAAFAVCAALIGCGSKSSSSTTTTTTNPVTVVLSPGATSVITGTTVQFSATVSNATNTAVTWEVNNVTGGSATTGTISTAGLYTAPATVPNPNTVEIEAVSQQDTTIKGTAGVTVTAPAPTTHIDISPPSAILPAGAQQTFTAAINGQAASVTWSLNCAAGTVSACGSITSAGVYTAPTSPPPGGTVSLTATVTSGNTPPANASITIQFSNGTLVGRYAFAVMGQGFGDFGGSITLDGNGSITGGVGDYNNGSSGAGPFTPNVTVLSTSSYHIGSDGRGTMTLNTNVGSFTFALALVNHAHGDVIRFESGIASASGTLDLQDSTQFTLSAFTNQRYAFSFINRATDISGGIAGAGAVQLDGFGSVSSGIFDLNIHGSATSSSIVSGFLPTLDPNTGRGALVLSPNANPSTGFEFGFYVIDATHVRLVGVDSSVQWIGDWYQQTGSPFSSATFGSSYAATAFGAMSGGVVGMGGTFTPAGSVAGATFDVNRNGNVQNNSGVTGSFAVTDAATGRFTLTIFPGGSTVTFAGYPQAGGRLSLIETDASNLTLGTAYPQQSAAFSSSAIFGNWALLASGADLVVNPGEEDIVGQWLPNGGTAFSGVLDVNDNGTVSHGTQNSLSGSYQISASNGRAQGATMSANNFGSATVNFYVVDANTILFLEQDSNRVLTGILQKQY